MVALSTDNPGIPTKWSPSATILFCENGIDGEFSGHIILDFWAGIAYFRSIEGNFNILY